MSITDHAFRWLADALFSAALLLLAARILLAAFKHPAHRRQIAIIALAAAFLLACVHVAPIPHMWSLAAYDMQQPRLLPWLDDTITTTATTNRTTAQDRPSTAAFRAAITSLQPLAARAYANLPIIATTLYLGVSVLLAVRMTLGWLWLRRLLARSRPAEPQLLALLDQLPHTTVNINISPDIDRPLLCGLRHSGILLPAHIVSSATPAELPAILAHELAHHRAGDLRGLLLILPCVILFHPLPPLWSLLRALRLSQEELADRAGSAALGSPLAYAEMLARFTRPNTTRTPPLALAAWRSTSETFLRLHYLLRTSDAAERHHRNPLIRTALALTSITLLLAGTALGMVTLNDTSPAAQLRASELHGITYLLTQQENNGAWLSNYGPAPTALIARALLQAGVPVDHPAIARVRHYLNTAQRPDGSFNAVGSRAYQTAVVLSFYAMLNDSDAHDRLHRGQQFLHQLAQPQPLSPWYNASPAARPTTPSERNPDDILSTYGNLSYANWKSLAYAQLTPSDHRITLANRWLQTHWTVDHHPGTDGPDGHFYYLMAATRMLSLADTTHPTTLPWQSDIQHFLLHTQQPNGSWLNTRSPAWMENQPPLVTAYALLSLQATRTTTRN